MGTTTTQVYVVVLTDTGLEYFVEPVGIGVVLEVVETISTQAVATRSIDTSVFGSLTEVTAVLVSIHHIVDAT